MATKDDYCSSSLKGKPWNSNNISSNDHRYSNLNLNQNHQKYSSNSANLIHSKIITAADNKNYENYDFVRKTSRRLKNVTGQFCTPCFIDDYFVEKNYKTDSYRNKRKEDIFGWNNSLKPSSNYLNNGFGKEEELEKQSISSNNSTLSLHIAAYENSFEVIRFDRSKAAFAHLPSITDHLKKCIIASYILEDNNIITDTDGDDNKRFKKDSKERSFLKKWDKTKQFFVASSPHIHNTFEFQRQQKEDPTNPEVMQFKARQKLINTNESNASIQNAPLHQQSQKSKSKKHSIASLKSLKSFKSGKSTKSQKATTTEGVSGIDDGQLSAERRVVLYEGSAFHTKSGIKLKKNALYEIIGVPITASQGEIKKAYRQKILLLHPDKNIGVRNQEELNEKLGQINRAYKILSDPTKRKIYDQYGIDAVQTFEETEISPSWLWFVYTRLGRIATCLILLITCCFCCFCCCACFCDCFCGCCCNRCCKSKNDENEDGYMEYDPEAPPSPPPPPKSKLASFINTLSSKKVIKKKKPRNPSTGGGEDGIPMTDGSQQQQIPTSIRVDPRSTPSKIANSQRSSHPVFTRSTQEQTNEDNEFNDE